MKRFLMISLIIAIMPMMSAQTVSDIFGSSETEITYMGLDFSNANLIGSAGFTNPQAIRDRFFASWNNLILNESSKFNLEKTFQKSGIDRDIDMIMERNEKVDFANLVSNKTSLARHLEADDIQSIVSEYTTTEPGIGLVFIVESFNKITAQGNIYITFFDMQSKDVLFTKRMMGEPRGVGLRNYWAGAVYNILVKIQKKEYKVWKKQYGR